MDDDEEEEKNDETSGEKGRRTPAAANFARIKRQRHMIHIY